MSCIAATGSREKMDILGCHRSTSRSSKENKSKNLKHRRMERIIGDFTMTGAHLISPASTMDCHDVAYDTCYVVPGISGSVAASSIRLSSSYPFAEGSHKFVGFGAVRNFNSAACRVRTSCACKPRLHDKAAADRS